MQLCRISVCISTFPSLWSLQVVHILNMTTAQVHSFQLTPDESLHSLQKRIEGETKIEVVNQELLHETGVSLDPRKPAAQCALDGVVRPIRTAFLLEVENSLPPSRSQE